MWKDNSKMKEELVNLSKRINDDSILEAEFNILANHEFHKISDEINNWLSNEQ